MNRVRLAALVDPVVIGIGLVIFALDQLTKYLILQEIGPGATRHSMEVLGSYVRFAFTTNTGAVFGTFPQLTPILAIISLLAVPVILFSRSFFPSGSPFIQVCLGLLFGGNLGNMLDRWVRGYVVDFIDMGIGDLRWYTYNIADASFVIGVIALVFAMLFLIDDEPAADKPIAAEPIVDKRNEQPESSPRLDESRESGEATPTS